MNHRFNVDVAVRFGVNAAILFENIAYICENNRANESNEHDGNFWVYNTRKAFSELYPYLSDKQVRTALDTLVAGGLLIKGNYNKSAFDRTTWYAVTDEGRTIYLSRPMSWPCGANGEAREGQTIPDSIPNIKPNNKHNTFSKPTVEEIRNYVTENHYSIDPENFFDYYESRGWMVGKTHMKDWKASVRLWQRNQKPKASTTPPPPPKPKLSRRMCVRLLDYLHMEQMGVLYEDGEIKARGEFRYARVNGDDLYIKGDETTKRWEDAKCDPGTQLSDFFP
jgi:hypothetical protein